MSFNMAFLNKKQSGVVAGFMDLADLVLNDNSKINGFIVNPGKEEVLFREDMLTTIIEIWNCDRLSSLEGLQNMSEVWRNGLGQLHIGWCPRMADWSALDGIKLDRLKIDNCYTTPSFENLRFNSLELIGIPGVTCSTRSASVLASSRQSPWEMQILCRMSRRFS